MSLLAHYQKALEQPGFEHDPVQARAVQLLQDCHDRLLQAQPPSGLRRWLGARPKPVTGVYLWGGVGRGKTWLMDLFFESLPFEDKQRLHFHRFMQRVHRALRERAHESDPLPDIAAEWASKARVLCFDEFFVSDIADAMLLGGLLDGLFQNGVTLVATSNLPPHELYREGLQRARFLPAINLLQQHCQVMHMDGDTDYRLRILENAALYYHPLDESSRQAMTSRFADLAPGAATSDQPMRINGREFMTVKRGDGLVWFRFEDLLQQPSGASDFIEIARSFNTVLLSGITAMDDHHNDPARRLITLVDEFYDRGVKLVISAEVPIDELYTGKRLAFEFERTRSRLTEMQSHDYLARPHLA